MNRIIILTLVVALGGAFLLVSGCARGGDEQPVVPEVVLEVMIRYARVVEDASYYYAAFDTDGDFGADGPLPVAAGPRWGNGWGTGSLTHFVEYHQGRYELFRTDLAPELTQAATATSLGLPYEYVLPEGRDTLRFTLDLEQLGLNLSDLSINFISTTELIFNPTVVSADENVFDGLGAFGNSYFTLQTNQFQTLRNADAFVLEGSGDATLVGPGSAAERDSVDIVDWRVTLRRLR